MTAKRKAIYPGTFDPVTNGHLDIVQRATEIFDEVIIAVSKNSSKQTLFSLDQRLHLLKASLKKKYRCPVRVETFSGLLVNFAKKEKVKTLVRGLRAISDFEYEFQMALMNRHQAQSIETVFLMPDEKYVYLSSSMVREVARLGGNLSAFVPPPVLSFVKSKLR
jgi:pantetheine-phosphate adenylyltransferase